MVTLAPGPKRAGIDPGKTGGVAIYVGVGLVYAERLDRLTLPALYQKLAGCEEIVIERAQGTKQMGASNAFAYGDSYGQQRTVAILTGAKVYYVSPQWWKARLNIPTEPEAEIIRRCAARVGGGGRLLDFVKSNADHGIAEAACLGQLLLDTQLFSELVNNNEEREKKAKKKRVQYRL